jgi:hypothetical protein
VVVAILKQVLCNMNREFRVSRFLYAIFPYGFSGLFSGHEEWEFWRVIFLSLLKGWLFDCVLMTFNAEL